jgi:microcystin degradation protein MlrC
MKGKNMRLAVLGLSHESNTYAPVPASLERWLEAGPLEGEEIVSHHADAQSSMSGYLELGTADPGVEIVPLVYFRLTPMGAITAEAFETMVSRLLSELEANGPWDGVLLDLHGAAVSEKYRDADGEILARVRSLVGEGVPIGTCLDMHANVSQKMIDHATVVNSYLTNPHLDPRRRGRQVADLVASTVRGEINPVMHLEMVPAAINILRQGTSDSPMRELVASAHEQATRAEVLSVSIAEGFPYADVAEMGMATLAVTDGDPVLAEEIARRLGDAIWKVRDELVGHASDIDDALRHAAQTGKGPVVLLDVGDNVGGGSPADSTYVLAAAKRIGVGGLFQSLCDPQAVASCMDAGVGATLDLDVGGKTDNLHGSPVRIRGTVRMLSDGKWEDPGDTHGGQRFFDTGPTAVVYTTDDHTLLLNSLPQGNLSRQQLVSAGIDPLTQPIIVAKGVHSPRAAFEPIAAEMLWLNTPGCTAADLTLLEYEHRRRPMFPWEPDASYPA